jgi:hypothetical protein
METDAHRGLPEPGDVCRICVVDAVSARSLGDVAETTAWNWQQGAMAQWWPVESEQSVIYNDRDDDRYVSHIVNGENGRRRTLPLPIYTVDGQGDFALSVSFARLRSARPAYGYAGLDDRFRDQRYPEDDGIYWMDLRTGDHRLVLSYAQVAAFGYSPLMEAGVHTLEHLMIAPGSCRFCFLHRYPLRDGGLYTRLLTAASDGTDLRLLGEGWISHMCWMDPQHIVAWSRRRTLASALRNRGAFANLTLRWALNWVRRRHASSVRQRLTGDCYRVYRDAPHPMLSPPAGREPAESRVRGDEGLERRGEPLGRGVLTEDGHCTVSPDGAWLLTDTYPSEDRHRTLILFNLRSGRRIDAGSFHSPEEFDGPLNCDLHPRFNASGTHVCIDSTHQGSRQVYVVDVRPALEAGSDAHAGAASVDEVSVDTTASAVGIR